MRWPHHERTHLTNDPVHANRNTISSVSKYLSGFIPLDSCHCTELIMPGRDEASPKASEN